MSELGEALRGLPIPGSDDPPERVFAAARGAIGRSGPSQRSRWRTPLITAIVALVGIPTAFAIGETAGDNPGVDMASAPAERSLLYEQRAFLSGRTPRKQIRAEAKFPPLRAFTRPKQQRAAPFVRIRPVSQSLSGTPRILHLRPITPSQRAVPTAPDQIIPSVRALPRR